MDPSLRPRSLQLTRPSPRFLALSVQTPGSWPENGVCSASGPLDFFMRSRAFCYPYSAPLHSLHLPISAHSRTTPNPGRPKSFLAGHAFESTKRSWVLGPSGFRHPTLYGLSEPSPRPEHPAGEDESTAQPVLNRRWGKRPYPCPLRPFH